MTSTIFTRDGLADAVRKMREAVDVTSRAMVRIQFGAPWKGRCGSDC